MTKRKRTYKRGHHIRVRGERREEIDYKKLGRALIMLAQAQAEADAEAEAKRRAAQARRDAEAAPDRGADE